MNSKENLIYKNQYDKIKEKLNQYSIEENLLIEDQKRKILYLKKLEKNLFHTEEAKIIIRHVAQKTQEELQWKISEIVSLALSAVFENPYEFLCEFAIKRGKSEAFLKFKKEEFEYNPMEDTGGGAVDVASFALRVACWKLSKKRNIIILDEPFKHLSKEMQIKASKILKLLSKKLKIQFIIITHSDTLEESADKIFRIRKIKNKSIVEIEKG